MIELAPARWRARRADGGTAGDGDRRALAAVSAAPFYRDVAAKRRVALIEKALPTLSDDNLGLDAVHPNAALHAALARRAHAQQQADGGGRG